MLFLQKSKDQKTTFDYQGPNEQITNMGNKVEVVIMI